jgi:hypothetical protein
MSLFTKFQRLLRNLFFSRQVNAAGRSGAWLVQGDDGKFTFRPFDAIGDKPYRLYHTVKT